MTRSNVLSVRHVVMSVFINSMCCLFNSVFAAHADNMSAEISIPVTCAVGLFANMHNDTPPVPMPTSRTVFAFCGANAANHTASEVGLYMPRCILTRPPSSVKMSCFAFIYSYNKASE